MSLEKIDSVRTLGTHIIFEDAGASESGKTRVFTVHSTHDSSLLGEVRWFARWRKYCFFPTSATVFEQICMRDVSDFIEIKTKEHGMK